MCVSLQRGTLGNVQDASINTAKRDNNYGASGSLAVGYGSIYQNYPFVKWDVSPIPAGATVTYAQAIFNVSLQSGTAVAHEIHSVVNAWSESAITVNTSPGYYGNIEATLPASYGQWQSANLQALVQHWVDGSFTNNGIMVLRPTSIVGAKAYFSSEVATVSLRPRLDVCYNVSCPGPNCPTSSGPGPVAQISAGVKHTCVVKTDGSLACWGDNSRGQSSAPGGNSFKHVGEGAITSCAVRTDGSVACWGDNYWGQGNVPGGSYSQVSLSAYHACGLKTDGSVACWGNNYNGQSNAPSGAFTKVTAGLYHSCGLRTNGVVSCWGYNGYGEAKSSDGTIAASPRRGARAPTSPRTSSATPPSAMAAASGAPSRGSSAGVTCATGAPTAPSPRSSSPRSARRNRLPARPCSPARDARLSPA